MIVYSKSIEFNEFMFILTEQPPAGKPPLYEVVSRLDDVHIGFVAYNKFFNEFHFEVSGYKSFSVNDLSVMSSFISYITLLFIGIELNGKP